VGFCHLRVALRTFRVDRIQDTVPLEDRFTKPRDFSVREYLERSMDFAPAHRVVVRLEANAVPNVRERHGHWMDLTDEGDGSVTARFGVANLDWATGWVLSYGAAAQALEPPELIARVRRAAEGALSRYEPEHVRAGSSDARDPRPVLSAS